MYTDLKGNPGTHEMVCSDDGASRIAEANRAIVDLGCGSHHVDQLILIRRSHYDHVRQARHECNIKCTVIHGTRIPHQSCTCNHKADRDLLPIHIVDDLEYRTSKKSENKVLKHQT